jgi:hypothetical protein
MGFHQAPQSCDTVLGMFDIEAYARRTGKPIPESQAAHTARWLNLLRPQRLNRIEQ